MVHFSLLLNVYCFNLLGRKTEMHQFMHHRLLKENKRSWLDFDSVFALKKIRKDRL